MNLIVHLIEPTSYKVIREWVPDTASNIKMECPEDTFWY